MKSSTILTSMVAAFASQASASNLNARAACNRDNCFRASIAVSTASADCSSFMVATVTPCPTTTTTTTTVTSTATVGPDYPMKNKRDTVQVRKAVPFEERAAGCTPTTSTKTDLPKWATSSCEARPTPANVRVSSACSCGGVTGSTTTVATPTSTVTSTATATATVTSTPQLFVLQDTGYQRYYITVGGNGQVVMTSDASAASPFYFDSTGNPRSITTGNTLARDVYIGGSGPATDVITFAAPSDSNYALTCSYTAHNSGDFWGVCQAAGSPGGNPLVYGFGICPGTDNNLYMIPNNSNVRCSGGYAFAGFYLRPYTPSAPA